MKSIEAVIPGHPKRYRDNGYAASEVRAKWVGYAGERLRVSRP